jgi:hypothetical protein
LKKVGRDTRPVKCLLCSEKMYYFQHTKHEEEYTLVLEDSNGNHVMVFYVHKRCWDYFLEVKRVKRVQGK